MFNPNDDAMMTPYVFHGNYRGRVVNVDDPYGAGRIKVRVYGVYDGVTDEQLPWAIFADPFMGGQEGFGGYFVPDVGNDVWVFFEEGNHMLPVYFAGAPARPHGPDERGTPPNRVLRTRAGHLIELDDSDGNNRIHIHHSSGTEVTIDDEGNIDELCVGNIKRVVKGNIEETVEGNVTINVTGNVTESFDSNFTTSISGNKSETTSGSAEYKSSGVMDIQGSRVNIN